MSSGNLFIFIYLKKQSYLNNGVGYAPVFQRINNCVKYVNVVSKIETYHKLVFYWKSRKTFNITINNTMAHLSCTNRLPSWNSILLQIFLLIMCCQSSFTQVRFCFILSSDISEVLQTFTTFVYWLNSQ